MKLILGSSSLTRKRLLTDAGLAFEIDPSNYEEDMTLPMPPKELVAHLSRGKAKDVAQRHKKAIVLGADTIIVYKDKILGKPHTPEKAKEMLKMLSGKQHSAITGFTIINTENNNIISKSIETKVFFRDLADKEIDDYISTGEPLNKAGSYAILELGGNLIDRIEGSKTNVSGLPMEEVMKILKEFGIEINNKNLPQLVINKKKYNLIKKRAYTPVSIWGNDKEILRIGPKDLMIPELDLHKKLLGYGFPVPVIITEGEYEDQFYYIEQSLGDNLFGDVFWDDCKRDGRISDKHFATLLKLTEKFAQAQLKTISENRDDESFYIGIHMDFIQEELPELKDDFLKAFEKLKNRTSVLPTVLTHGDLNAYNIFEKGIIDFGNSHYSPAGYDIVGNIYTTHNFPKNGDYESMRRYDFTEQQKDEYFKLMDTIYVKFGLPRLSDFIEDFIFAKTIWSTTRMHRLPKLQKWRYDRIKIILKKYLKNESFMKEVLDFK